MTVGTTAARELKVPGESLRSVAGNAPRTIETDTAAATGRMRGMLLRAWVRPLVIGLSSRSASAAGAGRRCAYCGRPLRIAQVAGPKEQGRHGAARQVY